MNFMRNIMNIYRILTVVSITALLSCNAGNDKTPGETVSVKNDSPAIVKNDTIAIKPMEKPADSTSVHGDKGKPLPAVPGSKKTKVSSVLKVNKDNNTDAEIFPQFPGGQKALDKFIADNVVYPEAAREHEIEGTVMVDFEIDKMGMIYTPHVKGDKLGYGLETEAMKVVNKMPLWVPARFNGKNIKTHYSLPITFQISQ